MEPRPGHYWRGPGASASQPGRTASSASVCAELKIHRIKNKNNIKSVQSRAARATNGLFQKFEKRIVHSANLEIGKEVLTAVKQH